MPPTVRTHKESTLSHLSVSHFAMVRGKYSAKKLENGNTQVSNFAVFRTGTFKDSWGDSHTWESEHLQQMVFNFNLLKDRNILPNVPVRDGHRALFGGGGSVIGYVNDLRVEGTDDKGNQLLVVDFEFTEPDAFEKFERGTFRARSSEVGYYETNDEVLYWPVFQGFAFVDIPAVEGLFAKGEQDQFTPIRDTEEEGQMPPDEKNNEGENNEQQQEGTNPAQTAQTAPGSDAQPSNPSEGGDGDGGDGDGDGGSDGNEGGAPEGGSTSSTSEHGATPPAGTFRIGGQVTSDFAAVQRYIDNQESLNSEFVKQTRDNFVEELAREGKIAATQVEAMQEHARDLTVEQFEKFCNTYKDAPKNPLFAKHGEVVTNSSGASGTTDTPNEIEILKERVEFAKKSGMTKEQIEATDSYKKLKQLEASGA